MARSDDAASVASREAVERVLRAEREAEARLERAVHEADALRAAARDDARARIDRALARVARWQREHAARLDGRLQALQAQTPARAPTLPDASTLDAAAATVAAWLTSADDGSTPEDPA